MTARPTRSLDRPTHSVELAGHEGDGLRAGRAPTVGDFPPHQGDVQIRQALHQAGHVVTAGPHSGDEQIGDGEMGPVEEGGQGGADWADLVAETGRVGDPQQSLGHLHDAGDPPGAVGIEGHRPGRGVGDERGRAQVLENSDDLAAGAAGGGEPVVLGQ